MRRRHKLLAMALVAMLIIGTSLLDSPTEPGRAPLLTDCTT